MSPAHRSEHFFFFFNIAANRLDLESRTQKQKCRARQALSNGTKDDEIWRNASLHSAFRQIPDFSSGGWKFFISNQIRFLITLSAATCPKPDPVTSASELLKADILLLEGFGCSASKWADADYANSKPWNYEIKRAPLLSNCQHPQSALNLLSSCNSYHFHHAEHKIQILSSIPVTLSKIRPKTHQSIAFNELYKVGCDSKTLSLIVRPHIVEKQI